MNARTRHREGMRPEYDSAGAPKHISSTRAMADNVPFPGHRMRRILALVSVIALHGCALQTPPLPDLDAPAVRQRRALTEAHPSSYEQALRVWRSPGQVNAWIGDTFEYDRARAIRLSETQRQAQGSLPIHSPSQFFAHPIGVCVDLARFAVETLQAIAPDAKARYVMVEFAPVTMQGNTLRRHWLVAFERDGQLYFFADSKRPGYIAGPYASTSEFVNEYARYRGREVTAFRELASYQRLTRTKSAKRSREGAPDALHRTLPAPERR